MANIQPTIAGLGLFAAAFVSLYLGKDVSSSLMVLLALGAILVSLPAIKKFQLSKEGFVIEPADRPPAAEAAPPVLRHLEAAAPRVDTGKGAGLQPGAIASGALGLAFLYGSISGVLSGLLPLDDPIAKSLSLPAPIWQPAVFSIAVIAVLSKLRPINRFGLGIAPVAIYVSWAAAFQVAVHLYSGKVDWANASLSGACAGAVGGILLIVGLCIGFPQLRSIRTVATTAIVGTLAGLLLAPALIVPKFGLTGDVSKYYLYLLFVGWQGLVLSSVAYSLGRLVAPGVAVKAGDPAPAAP